MSLTPAQEILKEREPSRLLWWQDREKAGCVLRTVLPSDGGSNICETQDPDVEPIEGMANTT